MKIPGQKVTKTQKRKTTRINPESAKQRKKKDKSKMMCWHVFHFEQRYELSGDSRYPREKPLMFTRDFVGSGDDDESACHYQQIQILKSKSNYLMLRGAFSELKSIAANRARSFREYILDQSNQPASNKTIGLWLGISEEQAEQILSDIAEAGLIELIPLPDFKPEKSTKTKLTKRKKSATKKSKSANKSKKTAGSKSQGNPVPAQESPGVTQENSGTNRESPVSLLNKQKLKRKRNLNV